MLRAHAGGAAGAGRHLRPQLRVPARDRRRHRRRGARDEGAGVALLGRIDQAPPSTRVRLGAVRVDATAWAAAPWVLLHFGARRGRPDGRRQAMRAWVGGATRRWRASCPPRARSTTSCAARRLATRRRSTRRRSRRRAALKLLAAAAAALGRTPVLPALRCAAAAAGAARGSCRPAATAATPVPAPLAVGLRRRDAPPRRGARRRRNLRAHARAARRRRAPRRGRRRRRAARRPRRA